MFLTLPGTPQWLGGASAQRQRVQPVPRDSSGTCSRRWAAFPWWCCHPFCSEKCCCFSACLCWRVWSRSCSGVRSFQTWAVHFSHGLGSLVSEVFFECLVLDMSLTGSSTQAKARPQDSRRMEDTSPACTRSSRWVGTQAGICASCLKLKLGLVLKSFRKYSKNDEHSLSFVYAGK